MSKSTNNWGGYVACFMLGAITGAAIALLFAPQEGEETRKLLTQKANALKTKASDLTAKASDYSAEVAKTAKERWGSLLENVNASAQEVKQRLQSAVVKDGNSSSSAAAETATEMSTEE